MWTPVLVAASALLVTYLVATVRYKRLKQWASFPQVPPNPILGHLKAFDDFQKSGPGKPDRHPDQVFLEMNVSLGRPPLMLVDFRPVVKYVMLVVADHDVAEQITKSSKLFPNSLPRSPTWAHFTHLLGRKSIFLQDDHNWKRLRKQFNPAFQHQHLMTLLPSILDKSAAFVERLDKRARTDESFSLNDLVKDLTFDIIGGVALDIDLHAQSDTAKPSPIHEHFRALMDTFKNDQMQLPWFLAPKLAWKRRQLGSKIDAVLRDTVSQRIQQDQVSQTSSRSILSMSLKGIGELTPDMLAETCDQLKSFLFAGHETTALTIAWALYELSRSPKALAAVRAEIDNAFGTTDPSPAAVAAALSGPSGQSLYQGLTYVAAVVRETLRLYPSAGTVRLSPAGKGFEVTLPSGERRCVDNAILYPVALIIQRDPAVYGDDVDDFVPERWLGERGARIPASAWRPFERGPRGCIGQELSLIEARIVLALVARSFDFVKVGLGELELDKDGQPVLEDGKTRYRVKSELYNTVQVTAQAVDGMMMKVRKVGTV